MAGPIACDMCHSEVAHYMIGDTETGEQLAVGDICVVAWSVARIEQALPPEGIAAVVQRLMERVGPPAPEGEAPRRARKRARGEPEPEPEPAPVGPEGAEVPRPDDDG